MKELPIGTTRTLLSASGRTMWFKIVGETKTKYIIDNIVELSDRLFINFFGLDGIIKQSSTFQQDKVFEIEAAKKLIIGIFTKELDIQEKIK